MEAWQSIEEAARALLYEGPVEGVPSHLRSLALVRLLEEAWQLDPARSQAILLPYVEGHLRQQPRDAWGRSSWEAEEAAPGWRGELPGLVQLQVGTAERLEALDAPAARFALHLVGSGDQAALPWTARSVRRELQRRLQGFEALAASPALPRVEAVQLTAAAPEELRALLTSPGLSGLTRLTLSNSRPYELAQPLLGALFREAPCMEALEELWAYDLGEEGLAGIAASPRLGRLRRLVLSYNAISAEVAQMLGAPVGLVSLRALDVRSTVLRPEGLAALYAGRLWQQLRELEAGGLGDAGLLALAQAPAPANLRSLSAGDMAPPGARDAGVAALAQAPWLAQLEHLDLSGTGLSGEGVRALAEAPLRGLRSLVLKFSRLGAAGAHALAAARWDALESLVLYSLELDAGDAATLAASGRLAHLRHLTVDGNPLGLAGLTALLGAPSSPLKTLRASGVSLRAEEVGSLLQHPGCAGLQSLALGEAAWTPGHGVLAGLLASPWLERLCALTLQHSAFTDEDALDLAASAQLPSLAWLDLTGCPITERGARALLSSPHRRLGWLNLQGCRVDPEALASLRATSAASVEG